MILTRGAPTNRKRRANEQEGGGRDQVTTASADVTVHADALPQGTVLWSNPGASGSPVLRIVPAVPSSEGVADVFAFHEDGTVLAITSEGITAWTADVSQGGYWWPGFVVPDFRGGLVYVKMGEDADSVVRLSGMTGQASTLYTVPHDAPRWLRTRLGVHPDGTIFAAAWDWTGASDALTVLGFDLAGGQKFTVTSPLPADAVWDFPYDMIIAGDGNAYVPYSYGKWPSYTTQLNYLKLLRVSSEGVYNHIDVFDWASSVNSDGPMVGHVNMITNTDQGIVMSWEATHASADYSDWQPHMAVISGGGASVVAAPGQLHHLAPALQLEDGSFIGTANDSGDPWSGTQSMIAFDASGALRWSVAGYEPQIATADGGVIATAPNGSAVTFDSTGAATGQMGKFFTQSWVGNTYAVGSILRMALLPIALATSFAADADRPAAEPLPDRVKAMVDVVTGTPSLVLRTVWYRLYQGNNSYAPQNRAVIREVHRNTYGPHPPTSASLEGKEFADDISTMGSGDFGLTQQFVVENIPGIRPYIVQMIVPCIANPGLVPPVKFGAPVPENVIRATSLAVLINGDAGSTDGRNCRYIQ